MGGANSVELVQKSIQESVVRNVSKSLVSAHTAVDMNQSVSVNCDDEIQASLTCMENVMNMTGDNENDQIFRMRYLESCDEIVKARPCGVFDSTIDSVLNFTGDKQAFIDSVQKGLTNLDAVADSEIKQLNEPFQFGNSIRQLVKEYQTSLSENLNTVQLQMYTDISSNQNIQVQGSGSVSGQSLNATLKVLDSYLFGSKTVQDAENKLSSAIHSQITQENKSPNLRWIIWVILGIVGLLVIISLSMFAYRRSVRASGNSDMGTNAIVIKTL